MATIRSQTFEPALPLDDPTIVAAAAQLDRAMPRNFGYVWLISAAQYANRTEVSRHAQFSDRNAYENVLAEADAPLVEHWRLLGASENWSADDLRELRAAEH
jgi:hypothetical protein